MEQAAPATDTAEAKSFKQSFTEKFRTARSVLKGAMGAGALVIGGMLVGSGIALPALLGVVTVYAAGRQLFEAGKELLPLEAQNAISKTFTGKEITEVTPVQPPKTVLGKVGRYVEYAALAVAGFSALGAGAYSMAWGIGGLKANFLLFGGAGVMLGSAAGAIDRAVRDAVSAVRKFTRKDETKADSNASLGNSAPDAAPASGLAQKSSGLAFNASAEMAVLAAVSAPQHKPAPPAAAPKTP